MKSILLSVIIFVSILSAQEKWKTEFEKSNYLATSNYDKTIDFFKQIAEASDYTELIPFGKSPQGRTMYVLIVDKDKNFNPIDISNRTKPVVMIQNGIHSGEIEGKDASMLLLREILITKEKEDLLDKITLLVIPVFNLDGHERSSKYNRINQNGPTEMGWRTTAQNLNLNRDYTKADTPEMKALLKLYSTWLPDLFIDTHTTDGVDYQYTITYGIETHQNVEKKTSDWINSKFLPKITNDVEADGFLVAPYAGIKDRDINKGITEWVSGPRFSHAYAAAQNRVGLLIETHMLKPYKDRVFATKSMLNSALEIMNKEASEILDIDRDVDKLRIKKYSIEKKPYPIGFKTTDNTVDFEWKGIEYEMKDSKAAGTKIQHYTGKKFTKTIPYYNDVEITKSLTAPNYYIIPKEYSNLVDIMKLHGIEVEELPAKKMTLVKTKFKDVEFPKSPYESHFRPSFGFDTFIDTVQLNKGDYKVSTDQRTVALIMQLLEPESNDSFIKWGLMNQIFERKEYFEMYLMDSLANKMYDEDPSLRTAFEEKLKEKEFADNPYARLNFFYERSPYFDEEYNVYPIMKSIK